MIRTHPLLNGKASLTAAGDLPPTRPPGAPWGLREAAEFLGISHRHLVTLADAGKVRTIRIGYRRLVPDDEVKRVAREGTR